MMRRRRSDVAAMAADVVAGGSCTGCGACPLIEPALTMQMDELGFMRPVQTMSSSGSQGARTRTFDAVCPGRRVEIERTAGATQTDATLGSAVSVWSGHATDTIVRRAGSSGGVLTALQRWMLEASEDSTALTTRADPDQPRRTVPHIEGSASALTRSSGSRYAPSATLELLASQPAGSAVLTAKPCEAVAARALVERAVIEQPRAILSFFCAGVPSQHATDTLLDALGFDVNHPLRSLRYRGDGWPGEFKAEGPSGETVSTTYDVSWGRHLGPTVQSRCKVCPDGVGRAADIVAGDFWAADENGYPLFDEQDGTSAVIARTQLGHDLLMRARAAGVVELEPADLADIARVQPLQVDRVLTLAGRRLGRRAGGATNIKVRGLSYRRYAVRHPVRTLRYAVGSWRRSRPTSC